MKGKWKPFTAGILNIISGVFCIIGAIVMVSMLAKPAIAEPWASYAKYSMGLGGALTEASIDVFIAVLAIALMVPGVIIFLGGIFAIRRRIWILAMVGAIFAFIYLPPLGILAIILLALSKSAFIKLPLLQ